METDCWGGGIYNKMKRITVGVSDEGVATSIALNMANRHGLIAGATGTGKTMTLRRIVEGFSKSGVPVFLADMKGDLSGISVAGNRKDFKERAYQYGETGYKFRAYPCCYWDVFKEGGLPVRATLSEIGPSLMARVLNLTRVQSGVLDLTFSIAHDNKFRLFTLQDLKDVLHYIGTHTEELYNKYGTIYQSSIGVIQRAVIGLEQQGATDFFDAPSLELEDLIRTESGEGVVNIMECMELVKRPSLYATFILWFLDKLYNELPEVGDCDKPKFVVFFDEAHLLFEDASKAITQKVSQIIRLIRSKGVGIYFITQTPSDIPDKVLSQLSNRVQHSLRAFTPKEQRAVKVAAQTFRPNPTFNTEECIMELGVGEALVSFLDGHGIPNIVERVNILPPHSNTAVISPVSRLEYCKRNCITQTKNSFKTPNYADFKDIPKEPPKANTNTRYNDYKTQYYNYSGSMFNSIFTGIKRGLGRR